MRNASCYRSSRMKWTATDGFTLVEILIVVMLVAVMAAATIPTVADAIQRYSLTSAGQQVVSTIRSARQQAVGQNATGACDSTFRRPGSTRYWTR